MSPSRIFILRPVATSLLMIAILLAGAVGYLQLPVSALPEVDYPTIQIMTFYPGANPDVMASSLPPSGTAVRTSARLAADDFRQFERVVADHSTIRSQPQHRRRRARSTTVDQCVRYIPTARPAESADL